MSSSVRVSAPRSRCPAWWEQPDLLRDGVGAPGAGEAPNGVGSGAAASYSFTSYFKIFLLWKNSHTPSREDSKETAGDFGRQRCQPRASPPSRPSPQLHPLISRVSPHAVLPKDKPTAPWSCLLWPVPGAGSRSRVEAYGKRQNPTGTE